MTKILEKIIEEYIRSVKDATTTGTAKYRFKAYIVFAMLITLSIIIIYSNILQNIILLLLLSLLTFILNPLLLKRSLVISLIYICYFIVSGIIFQYLLGNIDIVFLIGSVFKIISFFILSSILLSTINLIDVLLSIGRVSPRFAISIVLAIRSLNHLSYNLFEIYNIYRINLSKKWYIIFLNPIHSFNFFKALIYLTIYSSLTMTEVLITKYNILVEMFKNVERGCKKVSP